MLSYPYLITDFGDVLADYALVPAAVRTSDKQPDDFLQHGFITSGLLCGLMQVPWNVFVVEPA